MIIRLVLLIALIGIVVLMIRTLRARPLKCGTCEHCRALFRDGSRCGFGNRETFKTIVHIENCPDYKRKT